MADRSWNSLFLWVVEFKVLAGIDPLFLQQIVQEGHADQNMKHHLLLQRFETLKTIEKNMGRMVSVDREQEDILESEGSESTDFEEHPYFGWIRAPKISKRPRHDIDAGNEIDARHDIDAGKNSVKRARSDIDAGRK